MSWCKINPNSLYSPWSYLLLDVGEKLFFKHGIDNYLKILWPDSIFSIIIDYFEDGFKNICDAIMLFVIHHLFEKKIKNVINCFLMYVFMFCFLFYM